MTSPWQGGHRDYGGVYRVKASGFRVWAVLGWVLLGFSSARNENPQMASLYHMGLGFRRSRQKDDCVE